MCPGGSVRHSFEDGEEKDGVAAVLGGCRRSWGAVRDSGRHWHTTTVLRRDSGARARRGASNGRQARGGRLSDVTLLLLVPTFAYPAYGFFGRIALRFGVGSFRGRVVGRGRKRQQRRAADDDVLPPPRGAPAVTPARGRRHSLAAAPSVVVPLLPPPPLTHDDADDDEG